MITVGKSYLSKNGHFFTCIFVEGDYAWLKIYETSVAYVWNLSGNSVSLSGDYDINPRFQVTEVQ